jgi:hypothetical protein
MKPIDTEVIQRVKRTINEELMLKRVPALGHEMHRWIFESTILTGGAISSLILNEEVNDWDLYIKDPKSIAKFSQHIMDENNQLDVKEINPKYMADTEVEGKLITAHATTFKNNVQVITMGAADMRKTFDYIHCMPWYDIVENKLYISEYQYNVIIEKRLVRNPDCVNQSTKNRIHRAQKFIDRGWKP